ncbi:MAG: rRNA maturation RNase YbeY [Rhodoluna sp.]|nr:rRNA maturation RNase YbeY [Rhodoluna sp.]
MSIEIRNESAVKVDEKRILELASFALDSLRIHPDSELEILFYDEEPMTELHIKFMDEPGPTDVLSFPMDELHPGEENDLSLGQLGSIVICPTVAITQAQAAGHEPINEMLLLTTHGILHLLGYDHAEPEEHRVMFGLQADILTRFYAQEA